MKRYTLIALVAVLLATAGCGESPTDPEDPNLTVELADLVVGTGTTATAGRFISVNYTGWLHDTTKPENKGTMFDTSVGKAPFSFFLGFRQVIDGWDLGIPGMRAGGKRVLIIPPGLGYGSQANGPIPANSTLIFEVELLSVQ